MEDMRAKLFYEQKNGYDLISPQEHGQVEEYAADYMRFLDTSRTEREAVSNAIDEAEECGFVPYEPGMELHSGMKIYCSNRGKALMLAVIGRESLANGAVIVIRLLIALIVLSIFNAKMTLAMFIVIPLALPFAVISYKRVAHTSAELIAIQQQTAANVIEYAGGITTLQAYDRTGSAFEGLKNSFVRLRDDSKRQEKAGGAVSMYGRAILFLGISIVMGVGAQLLSTGEITPFYYIMCLLAALQVYEPIMQLFVFAISMARINQCVEKLSELKEEKALDVTEPAQTTEHSDISFKDVHFAYDGKEEVIKGISFDIPERKFAALVGASGSGKTTIARLLARF